jgi:hypothetical protein
MQCLDTHLAHQGADVLTPDLEAFGLQQVLQHPLSGKGVIEVQFVDPPHQRQVGSRRRTRQVGDGAAADPQQLGLPVHRQFMVPVDQRFPIANNNLCPLKGNRRAVLS